MENKENGQAMLMEAIRLIRGNDIEGLASLYLDGFDIKGNLNALIFWASQSGNDHMLIWINAVARSS